MSKDANNGSSWEIPSLSKYVTRLQAKDEVALQSAAKHWLDVSSKNKMSYEIEWMGVPVIQTPEDLVLIQELLFRCKPDFIIETGIAHGGSLIFYASIFEILGRGQVIGIDIDIRDHNRRVIESHPLFHRIQMIEGSSISTDVLNKVKELVPEHANCIVCLDSNHYRDHVFKELCLYKEFVCSGSYMVVFDTITSELADTGACDKSYRNNGPLEAITDFLNMDTGFIVDKSFNKLYVSTSTDGYLKKIS